MYLKQQQQTNIDEIKNEFMDNIKNFSSPEEAFNKLVDFTDLQNVYSSALDEITTKLNILDRDLKVKQKHNPIHHFEYRIKNLRSLINKMNKKDYELSAESAKKNVMDIAGVRVICNYIQDIYKIEELLLKQEDVQLIKRKNYIKNPKANGYQSLHIIVSVPVFLSDNIEYTPVEIQFRTIGMDMWASLEHKLKYKNKNVDVSSYEKDLKECSEEISNIEERMQGIYNDVFFESSE